MSDGGEDDGAPCRIEKIMALSRAEFHRSLRMFAPESKFDPGAGSVELKNGAGHVTITFEELPEETLGGLLSLPRARVGLKLAGQSEAQQAEFMVRFDRAFQRGGG